MTNNRMQQTPADSLSEGQDDSASTQKNSNSSVKTNRLSFGSKKSSKGDTIIAVDIGYQDITLVKMAKTLGHKPKIVDYSRVPFDSLISLNTPTFSRLLEDCLNTFCGINKGGGIWTFISSSEVEVRRFIIPCVPKKIISKTVFLALKRELIFDDRDYVFDYSLQKKVKEGNLEKQAVLACVARKSSVNDISEQFAKIGFPLAGITLFPLAIQNLFRQGWLPDETASCDLCIGKGRSRIDLYLNDALVITRDIKTGIDSMVDQIVDDAFSLDLDISSDLLGFGDDEAKPVALSVDNITRVESKAKCNEDDARALLFGLCRNDVDAADSDSDVSEQDDVIKLIEPVLSRLVRQTDSTIKHYIESISRDGIDNVYISGALAESKKVVDYFGHGLSISSQSLESVVIKNAKELCKVDEDILVPGFNYHAAGLALSDYDSDINFLYTYEEKEAKARRLNINKKIFSAYLIFSLLLVTAFVWQNMLIAHKKDNLARLKTNYSQYSPYPDQALVTKFSTKAIEIKKQNKKYAEKYISIAVLSELIDFTPRDVKLKSVSMVIEHQVKVSVEEDGGRGKTAHSDARRIINIEGVVRGQRDSLESVLASYIVKLSRSRLFSQPDIVNSFIENDNGADSLLFTLNMKIK